MNKIIKIARKIASKQILTIKQLLQKKIDVNIIYHSDDSFELYFEGNAKLTPNGIAKWSYNNILDIKVVLIGDQAFIQDILTKEQINDLCALFNTIAGNVNKNTYNKYVEK